MKYRTDCVMLSARNSNAKLGAYTISPAHKDWILVTDGFEVKVASKTTDLSIGSRSPRRPDQRFDDFDQIIPRVNGHASGGVG